MRLSEAGRKVNILVVEDNPADLRLVVAGLDALSVPTRVTAADDGDEALNQLTRVHDRPDLILLDISLPRVDGAEVLSRVKQDPDLRCIPLIVLTSSADPADVRRMLVLGANSYVRKPHDADGFRNLARAIEAFWLTSAEVPVR